MRLVITGGHLSPAIAVIENLPSDIEIFFIGRKSSFEGDYSPTLEYEMIKSLGIHFVAFPSSRFQRKFTSYTIPSLLKLPYVFYKTVRLLLKIKPDVVLGFGGYVSFPVCAAAFFLKIPVVIHEQTLGAGLANREIARWAKKVCISWKTSEQFFPKGKAVLTGNPLRKEIIESIKSPPKKFELPIIYITGGSTGSHFINGLVEKCLAELLSKYKIIHQTGDSRVYNDFERLSTVKKTLPEKLSKNYNLRKFVSSEEVGSVLQNATIVASRAGINTITELMYLKKPALLIPLPFAQNNEQNKNALFAKDIGIAEILEQDELSPAKFVSVLTEMVSSIDKYKPASDLRNLIDENAAVHIISVVTNVAKKEKQEK